MSRRTTTLASKIRSRRQSREFDRGTAYRVAGDAAGAARRRDPDHRPRPLTLGDPCRDALPSHRLPSICPQSTPVGWGQFVQPSGDVTAWRAEQPWYGAGCTCCDCGCDRPSCSCAAVRPRRDVVQHRRPADAGRPARAVRAARLLDVLLRQLPARHRRAAPARAEVRRRPDGHRRALAEVRAREVRRRGRRRRRALRGRPRRGQRSGNDAVAAVRRAGVADARPGRPGGVRRRAGRRRGPGQRTGRDHRPARRRARAARNAAPRRRPVPPAGAAADRRCASRPRRSRLDGLRCSSPTPAITSSSNSRSTARPCCAGSAAVGAASRSPSPTGSRCCRPVSRRTTWSWPTPRTTCCAACGSRTAPWSRRSTCPPGSRTPGRSPARCRPSCRRGTWSGGRPSTGSSSRLPACTCCSSVDPRTDAVEVLAGTTVEGLRDGPALDGWLAQPSGLAVDGDRLWFVDAETSALRWLSVDGELHTAVGEGLFDFGHVDGPAAHGPAAAPARRDGAARPLGRGARHLQRRGAPLRPGHRHRVARWPRDLAEPSGAVLVDGELVVVESAAHRLLRPVPRSELVDRRSRCTPSGRSSLLAAGAVRLDVRFAPAPGRKLDERYGPSTRLTRERLAARPARSRRRRHGRADPRAAARPGRGRAARHRPGGVLRRGAASIRPATSPGRTGACRCGSSTPATASSS